MQQISKALEQFYTDLWEQIHGNGTWINHRYGLCSNLTYWAHHNGIGVSQLLELEGDQYILFTENCIDPVYPFDHSFQLYLNSSRTKTQFLNAARLAWIDKYRKK